MPDHSILFQMFQYYVIWYWRKFTAVSGACILIYKAYSYKDIHELNHQHLQDLRTQFSNFSKVLKGMFSVTDVFDQLDP